MTRQLALGWVVALAITSPAPASEPLRPWIPPPEEEAAHWLSLVRDQKVPHPEARRLVQWVGGLDRPAVAPVLKEIASAWSKQKKYYVVAFDALHALWSLGGPRAYFLECVAAHGKNKKLADYAISILARDPDQETIRFLRTIWKESDDSHIQSAVNEAVYTRDLVGQYEKLDSVEAKANFLLKYCPGSHGSRYEPEQGARPIAVWSERKLKELAAEHPLEVAQRLVTYELPHKGEPTPESLSYRAHASARLRRFKATLLPAEAQAIYERLRQREDNRKARQQLPIN